MKFSTKNKVYLALIFLLATAFVVYFMPGDSKHKYTYELNRPWSHELLTAPFDIPVYRDSASVRIMIDSINREFVPIMQVNRTASNRITAAIRSSNLSEGTRNRLLSLVSKLYADGVTDASTAALIAEKKLTEMKFNIDNVNVTRQTGSFRSQRDAYAYIDSTFSHSPERGKIQALNLSNLLGPNIVEDTHASDLYRETLQQPVLAAVGVIQKGERIIDRGDRVTPQIYQILKSFEQALEKQGRFDRNKLIYTLIGKILFTVCIFLLVFTYFRIYKPHTLTDIKKSLAVVLLITLFFIFSVAMSRAFTSGLYIVPLAILPIVLQVFFDGRTAFFTYIAEVLLCSVLASFPLEFVFLEVLVGAVVIFSLRELTKRSQLVRSALLALATYIIGYLATELMSTGTLTAMSWRLIGYFAINAVLISFAYILILVVEKLFGMTSVVTLVELSDINNPLLIQLSQECPGTFQHSMAVSNLASEAAHKVGANVQLVRAGALYHDIGKINNPAFFTENQYGTNPHDALSPDQSARIIISHVTDGIKLADKHKLPQVVKDFILQHHGEGKAKYFYIRQQQLHPDEEVDPAPFTYPGPNPQTTEASLLMMADSVEAASRSLTDHSEAAIKALVDRLIDQQIADGLHNNSPLSFKDVNVIKDTFTKRLRSMYHGRISYPPETKKTRANDKTDQRPA